MSAVLFFVVWMTVGLTALLAIANWKYIAVKLRNEIRWRRRPLVFVCENNGRKAVATARDYYRTLRRYWRGETDQVIVWPMFLFKGSVQGTLVSGYEVDFDELIAHCRVMPGNWYVPQPWASLHEHVRHTCGLDVAYIRIFGRRRGSELYRRASKMGMIIVGRD